MAQKFYEVLTDYAPESKNIAIGLDGEWVACIEPISPHTYIIWTKGLKMYAHSLATAIEKVQMATGDKTHTFWGKPHIPSYLR